VFCITNYMYIYLHYCIFILHMKVQGKYIFKLSNTISHKLNNILIIIKKEISDHMKNNVHKFNLKL